MLISVTDVSDILTEAGAMHENRPMTAYSQPSPHPVPKYPAPNSTTEGLRHMSAMGVPDIPSLAPVLEEPMLSMDDWNHRRLLLTEMGYLVEQPITNHSSNEMPNIVPVEYNTYSSQPGDSAPMTATAQVSSMENNDLFTFWSGIPTPFTRCVTFIYVLPDCH